MSSSPEVVARSYFERLAARDAAGMAALWAPDGREHIRGQVDVVGPQGVKDFFDGFFAALPDVLFVVESVTADEERAAVRWTLTGTFSGAPFAGIAPTGTRITMEGIDELTVSGGLITANNAFTDNLSFARQVGLLPPEGSRQDRGLTAAFNARTRLNARIQCSGPEPVADGVWRVRGGVPTKGMNVYLVRDGDGVLAFDAGIASMAPGIALAAAQLGGLTRVVLGHGHEDHRGSAPALGVPVLCHPDARADAEGDGGRHYFDFTKLRAPAKQLYPHLLSHWDGGPVPIAGTVKEGDDVAGFEVVLLPGHAPGLIALWRAGDGVALTTDVFYTANPETGRPGHARVPMAAFNQDTEQARASVRKLAALQPRAAFPGHAHELTGDVAAQLETAAATT